MLILSRKVNESIMLNDDIEITVVEVDGSRVRLGISAPKDVQILRKELYIEVEDENIKAASKTTKLDEIKSLFKRK